MQGEWGYEVSWLWPLSFPWHNSPHFPHKLKMTSYSAPLELSHWRHASIHSVQWRLQFGTTIRWWIMLGGTLPPNVVRVCVCVYMCRCVYMCCLHWSLCKLAFFQYRKLWLMARSCNLPLLSCSGIKPPIFKAWTPLQPMHLVIHSTVLIIMYYYYALLI